MQMVIGTMAQASRPRARAAKTFNRKLVSGLLTLALGWHAAEALSATYYVDPSSGNDANAGTSQAAPWKTIPGTRTASNSGWLRSNWGAISSTNKLQPGDVVQIKAGTTMSASIGGKLWIDATYYNNGTSAAPITIQVSPSWGTGNFTFNASGMTPGSWMAAIDISRRDYITVKGASADRRFVVQNSSGDWAFQIYGNSSTHSKGHYIEYMEFANNRAGGFNVAYADGWTVANAKSHHNGTIGFAVGTINDENSDNGLFIDSDAYNNGSATTGYGIAHGFGVYGSSNIRFVRCKGYSNRRDGFDFGTATNNNPSSTTVVSSSAYDNGEDGFGTNAGYSSVNKSTYINSIAYNNGQAGWHMYDGVIVELFHVVAHNNGNQSGFGGNLLLYTEDGFKASQLTIRNSIMYKAKAWATYGSYGSRTVLSKIVSDNNLYIPRSSDSEVFSEYPFGTQQTYSNPPSWVGPNDKLGIAYDPKFTAISTTSFANNNYRLTSGSSYASNKGVALTGVAYADQDGDGKTRGNPPDIGAYEYGTGVSLPAPTNLRVVN